MATQQSVVDFITDQLHGAGDIRSRKMFGEYALYCNEKVIAFVCDDQLYMKITPSGHSFLDASHEAPAYPGSKPYLKVPEEKWEDREWLTEFVQKVAEEVPAPKPKKHK